MALQHVDFRGKSDEGVRLFASFITPLYGHYILSVTHSAMRDADDVESHWGPCMSDLERDTVFATAFRGLDNVRTLDFNLRGYFGIRSVCEQSRSCSLARQFFFQRWERQVDLVASVSCSVPAPDCLGVKTADTAGDCMGQGGFPAGQRAFQR